MTVPDLQAGRGGLVDLLHVCTPRPVKRGNKDLSPQFGFGCAASDDGKLFAYIVLFRRSIGAWMIVDKNDEAHRSGPEVDYSRLRPMRAL
jgi:hypothetical protein